MRIVEDSQSHLRLRENFSLLSTLLLGASGLTVAFAILRHADRVLLINAALFAVSGLFFRRVSEVDLDKGTKHCRISRLDVFRRSERMIAFDEITDVRVEIQRADTSAQDHARLNLVTATGAVALTAGFAAGVDAQIALREAMVDVIFLGRPRPAPLDPVRVLAQGGRVFHGAVRLARRDGVGLWEAWKRTKASEDDSER
jgi:hypothetical protein